MNILHALRPYVRRALHTGMLIILGVLLICSSPVQAAGWQGASIYLYPSPVSKMCIGQTIRLTGYYRIGRSFKSKDLQPGNTNPLSPLIEEIDATATKGNIDPPSMPAGDNTSGPFFLRFTAAEAGTANISASILGGPSASITVQVLKACAFDYMFIAQVMNDFTDKGIQINETYIFTQAGRLEPTGDDPSSPLKDTSASLAYTGDLLRYDIPPKNGSSIKLQGKHQATGKAQAGADGEFVSNGENLHFTMNKQQLIPATDIMMLVSGKAGSLPVNFPDFLGEMLIQYFNQHAG
ncbi:MAG: hypothetical protein ABSA01_11045, partial [Anaerolineales bacterium]